MGRRRVRWLRVGADQYVWSVRHAHDDGVCREFVRLTRDGAPGQLVLVFRSGDGVYAHAGAVQHPDGRVLNFNLPRVIRAVLDEAIDRGWQPDAHWELDGWPWFDALSRRSDPAESR
ncbi:hypothetical protein [Lentzea flava]|uniref:Uncharacterized protein n=1 Tax=Lentzea flava TaxID=103732 RepID=A0ABQ2USZ2_9PSEU|nr:hypothetical protein [Lentzea flava]MCP2201237.1 hypothetical protein [Lentzea flava]GGU49667.1 hypothetical protein GCM10010178_48080 [Lentzea flava]